MRPNLSPAECLRYGRQMMVPGWGEDGQTKLKNARILVVGAGGLGAPVLMYLAAAGVGRIGVADGDFVEISNLHRQVIHAADDLDRSKAASAAAFMRRSNPEIEITEHAFPINGENAADLIGAYDLVADCSDNFVTRDVVATACAAAKVPLVSGAAQITDGTVTTFKPYLGRGHPCFRCLYPEALSPELTPSCAEIGVMGPVLAVIGGLQAVEVLKELIGFGDSLSGRVLVYDGLAASVVEIALGTRQGCRCANNAAAKSAPAISRP